jgi:two-component system, NarL family, response regulator NreC
VTFESRCGCVFKSDGAADLITAVEALQQHRSSFSSRVSDLVLGGYLQRNRVAPPVVMLPELSPREREVVQLVSEGKTSREVATTHSGSYPQQVPRATWPRGF